MFSPHDREFTDCFARAEVENFDDLKTLGFVSRGPAEEEIRRAIADDDNEAHEVAHTMLVNQTAAGEGGHVSNLRRRKLVAAVILITGSVIVVTPRILPAPDAAIASSFNTPVQDLGDGGTADDAVRRILLAGPNIPKDIFAIRRRLEAQGGRLKAHLVVNGGHDNPARTNRDEVKFMCFATYSNNLPGKTLEEDELFLGFFLGAADNTLQVLSGFVEIIAWDRTKQVYNFWELIGTNWHYRGDSNDVLTNIERINTGGADQTFNFVRKSPTDGQPVLRCSGCHTLGGPVMKELEPPHNDWWKVGRKFDLGPFKLRAGDSPTDPAHVAARLFDETKEAADADNLSAQVKRGVNRLLAARGKQGGGGQNLRQLLRPLFTTVEMNLVSDRAPFKERQASNEAVEVPQDFFVDARLAGKRQPVPVKVSLYKGALREAESRFAPGETPGLQETHHAFLVPARSHIDNQVIDALISQGTLDEELVADVLAVDFTTPVFSPARAALLRHVPEKAQTADDLRRQLIAALKNAPPADRAAQELLANLTDPSRTAAAHRQAANAYLAACVKAADTPEAVIDWLKVAAQRRVEIVAAATARHPQGNITEPGFRVIFPVSKLKPRAGEFRLDLRTGRAIASAP